MDLEQTILIMETLIQANIDMENHAEKVNIYGKMEHFMKDSLKKGRKMAMEFGRK